MGGVVDGSPVSAAVTNPAFLDANGDDVALGKIGFVNTDPVSGSSVTNIQREANATASYTGMPLNSVKDVKPVWTNNNAGPSTDDLFDRTNEIDGKFDPATGHRHTGAAGDAPPVAASSIATVPLRAFGTQGTNLTGVTGGSTNVSTQLSGKIPSTSSSAPGVVVNAPYNKIILRNSANGDEFVDAFGNIVYGRLTESSGTWTLTYYSDVSGTETAYSFSGSNGVSWYYQELFNPLGGLAPTYDPAFFTPSDNATADVVDASTTQRGLVNITTQSFSGDKSFTGSIDAANLSGDNTGDQFPDVTGSFAFPMVITAAGGIGLTGSSAELFWFVQGSSGGTVITANPQINSGSFVGQKLTLYCTSTSDFLTVRDADGVVSNGDVKLILYSVIRYIWDGTLWVSLGWNGV